MIEITTKSPKKTQQIGFELGKLIQPADLILLTGELGTGKTCFTQGLAQGAGYGGYASSPSFVLMREYEGNVKICHIDLYRLDDPSEVSDLGIEDYLTEGNVCVIEWAEKGSDILPPQHLCIEFEYLEKETHRKLRFEAHGARYDELLKNLQKQWN